MSDVEGEGQTINNDIDGEVSFNRRLNDNSDGDHGKSFFGLRNYRVNNTDN